MGDFVSIRLGVIIASQVEIGTGAVILPKASICAFYVVGAGLLVTCDVPVGSNPARALADA
jgi:acetyltransferase-like isoleucine patch superfamily enzyme